MYSFLPISFRLKELDKRRINQIHLGFRVLILFACVCVLLAALYNDYADEDIPNVARYEEPAAEPSVCPSPSPVPLSDSDDNALRQSI